MWNNILCHQDSYFSQYGSFSKVYFFSFNLGLKMIVMNEMGGHTLERWREDEGRVNGKLHLACTYYMFCIYSVI